ncbi:MAG: hypothetical protein H0X38_09715 [Planctomycetes bacterium]|nr:hypothetical protein [Planctomycetota bacterium]
MDAAERLELAVAKIASGRDRILERHDERAALWDGILAVLSDPVFQRKIIRKHELSADSLEKAVSERCQEYAAVVHRHKILRMRELERCIRAAGRILIAEMERLAAEGGDRG